MDVINHVLEIENSGVFCQIRICEEQMVISTHLRALCKCSGCLNMESVQQSCFEEKSNEVNNIPALELMMSFMQRIIMWLKSSIMMETR